jgi:hypothetical protein
MAGATLLVAVRGAECEFKPVQVIERCAQVAVIRHRAHEGWHTCEVNRLG